MAAFVPNIGITWIPEEQAAKLPVRARGTESRHAYVIAKEPSEVDDDWRQVRNGASPGPNPLQLTGVPEVPTAGPSTGAVRRPSQYDSLPGSSTAVSTLFRNPSGAPDRTVTANSSNVSISGVNILHAPPAGSSRSGGSRSASDPLGLSLASLPEPRESLGPATFGHTGPEPSPASTWGSIPVPSTRNSSLNNLGNIQNLPEPHPFPLPYESLDELPIGDLNGGPVVLTDAVTPRHSRSQPYRDNASISGHTDASRDWDVEMPEFILDSNAPPSGQAITSLRDLEEVNRSLMQLSQSQERQSERSSQRDASRSSRPSTHHSRHLSMSSGDPDEAMIGPRTGVALYSSRPATNYASVRPSNIPSPPDASQPAQSRPRSGMSSRSHAESTSSSFSHYSIHSAQSSHSAHSASTSSSYRSSDRDRDRRRSRRGSTAVFPPTVPEKEEPAPSWRATPTDMQPYASASSTGPYRPQSRSQTSQKSHESVPRTLNGAEALNAVPGSLGSLLLNFGPENNTAAVTATGEEAAGIHAPRPMTGRRSSLFGSAWNARSGR